MVLNMFVMVGIIWKSNIPNLVYRAPFPTNEVHLGYSITLTSMSLLNIHCTLTLYAATALEPPVELFCNPQIQITG